jgi:hypothetical protein
VEAHYEHDRHPGRVLIVDETTGEKRRPLTSLEILQSVLHGDKYKAEFEAVEVYMGSKGRFLPKRTKITRDQKRLSHKSVLLVLN